jgi:hypothetical protein
MVKQFRFAPVLCGEACGHKSTHCCRYYHDGWNHTTALEMIAAYPPEDFATPAHRFVTAGTDFCFRCGAPSRQHRARLP